MERLHVFSTDDEIDAVICYLDDYDYVAYDTETTGLEQDATIVGLSVCADPEEAFYIVTAYWDVEQKKLIRHPNRDKVIELLKVLQTKSLVMHNAVVDCNWTNRNYGIQLKEALHTDTMVLAHLLDENRWIGLKELARVEFGEDAKKEQKEMHQSVVDRGGIWEQTYNKKTKQWKDKRSGIKEMYKADPLIMGKYGAKDTLLTLKLFYLYVPQLFDQKLDTFFYDEESMPLLRGTTYELNTVGLKVDVNRLKDTEQELKLEIARLHELIMSDVTPLVKEKYPATNKKNVFNIGASQQMSWLLFIRLGNDWKKLTDGGRDLAKELIGKAPYNPSGRRAFAEAVAASTDMKGRPLQLHKYLKADKNVMMNFAVKYKWIEHLLKYNQYTKLLNTYVLGIQEKMRYGVIHPSFMQTGTTAGRYSSKAPNFQNLPKKDKRIKKCIIARPGKIFVGADYSQLEPRVFASFAGDERLLKCFKDGEDFYSVIGIPLFQKFDAVPLKEGHPKAFGTLYPAERDLSKGTALSIPYGTTAYKLSDLLRDAEGHNLPVTTCEQIIKDYFEAYPAVKKLQTDSHKMAIRDGQVVNLFGRPRRIPEAKIIKTFGDKEAKDLPYEYRTLLNLAINHRIQSTGASIINRASIKFTDERRRLSLEDPRWLEVSIVMQVHDELVLEGPISLEKEMTFLLKHCMETAVTLPGVDLIAEPKTAYNIADLK